MKTNIKPAEQLTIHDVILMEIRQLRGEVKDTRAELGNRMDKLETRMQHLETEMRSSIRHSQILTVSVVGIAIAVIYAALR